MHDMGGSMSFIWKKNGGESHKVQSTPDLMIQIIIVVV